MCIRDRCCALSLGVIAGAIDAPRACGHTAQLVTIALRFMCAYLARENRTAHTCEVWAVRLWPAIAPRSDQRQNSANCAGLRCLSAGQLVTGPATRSARASRTSSASTARAHAWAMSCSTARRCHTRPGVGTGAKRAGAGWVCRMCSGVCSRIVSPWVCWPALTGQRCALCRARIPNRPRLRARARRAGHTLRWSLRRRAPSTRLRLQCPRPHPTFHRPACGGNRAP